MLWLCTALFEYYRLTSDNIFQIATGSWTRTCLSLGLYSLRRRRLISIGIPIINLRRSSDRIRFIMGIPIPVFLIFLYLYTKTVQFWLLGQDLNFRRIFVKGNIWNAFFIIHMMPISQITSIGLGSYFVCLSYLKKCMCWTGPFEFRWLKGYIYNPSYYHHQIGSIHLSHCCHIFRGCVSEMVVLPYSVIYYIYISGTLGPCFNYLCSVYWCSVYGICKRSDTLWPTGRVRYIVFVITHMKNHIEQQTWTPTRENSCGLAYPICRCLVTN